MLIGAIQSSVKSVQRGVYAGAGGTVTISSVNTSKSVVLSVSKGSSGYVAARGTVSMSLTPSGGAVSARGGGSTNYPDVGSFPNYSGSGSISGGTTDLTTKQFSAILTNATTLTCDGPVEWQVIEYY